MKYKKPPAYARSIIDRRDEGNHPERIWVIFGDDWKRRPENSVCVKPRDYRAGVFNWTFAAGIRVHVVERTRVEDPDRDALRMAAEIAEFTAPVVFHWVAHEDDWPDPAGRPAQSDVVDLLRSAVSGDKVVLGFPAYWDEKKNKQYIERSRLYRDCLKQILAQRVGALEEAS